SNSLRVVRRRLEGAESMAGSIRPPQNQAISRSLAEFVVNLDLMAVPPEVKRRAKHLLLDSLGVALASSSFEFGRAAARGLLRLETGLTPVIGLPDRLTLRDAAMVNGILVHGLDYDDT